MTPSRALAEAVQHDYGANEPGRFRRYRAGEWPIGEAGESHFAAMPDPGLGLPHARIASGDSFGDRSTWMSLSANAALQPNCDQSGASRDSGCPGAHRYRNGPVAFGRAAVKKQESTPLDNA